MALYLSNLSPISEISVSLLIYDPGCQPSGQPWRKTGWWNLNPGQSILPSALNVNLTTVNSWVGIYAYSGGVSWQGTGNAWFKIPRPAAFNQCGENENNCNLWVDYYGIEFTGDADYVVYFNTSPN